MKVSFVVPNYNHARYVGAAIESALAQTHRAIEIVVVDDGSSDDSRHVLMAYGDRIRAIFQANAGLSAARNAGVRAATGDCIALLDADDLVDATYAERLLAALAAAPGADGAYCGFRFVDQEGRPLPRVERRVVEPDALYGALLNGNFWVPESPLIRRHCYAACGEFDTGLRACEDWDVWLRFSRHYRLVGIPDVLIGYRVVTGSMSSNPQRMVENRLAVLHKQLGAPPTQPGTSAAHRAYANAWLRSAVEYLQAGDTAAAYGCLAAGGRLHPPLLGERATYAELAQSSQMRGSEGQPQQQIPAQRALLFDWMERLAGDEILGSDTRSRQPQWQAQALWAVAELHYRAGERSMARAALLDALQLDPRLGRQRPFAGLLARTFVSAGQMGTLKRMAGR